MTAPALSVVLITPGDLAELGLPLPGLQAQTIASRIELLIVAERGRVTPEEVSALTGFHSTRLIEVREVCARSPAAAPAIRQARAPFVALHENHTRAEPETYARALAAFTDDTAAVAPPLYAANHESAWGLVMYAMTYGHCAPPAQPGPRPTLPLHNAVYRTEMLLAFGEALPKRLANEAGLLGEFVASGLLLRHVPDAVVWHVNESRPVEVLRSSFILGHDFALTRSAGWPMAKRLVHAAFLPATAALALARIGRDLRRTSEVRSGLAPIAVPAALAAWSFAAGEALGYFARRTAARPDFERHEFHVRRRLNGRAPAKRWLRDAIAALPPTAL